MRTEDCANPEKLISQEKRSWLLMSRDEAHLLLALLLLICYFFYQLLLQSVSIYFEHYIYIKSLFLVNLTKRAEFSASAFLSWYQSFHSRFEFFFSFSLSLCFSRSKHGLYSDTTFFFLWFYWIWTKLNNDGHSFLSDA